MLNEMNLTKGGVEEVMVVRCSLNSGYLKVRLGGSSHALHYLIIDPLLKHLHGTSNHSSGKGFVIRAAPTTKIFGSRTSV